jgi:hypothetical protein
MTVGLSLLGSYFYLRSGEGGGSGHTQGKLGVASAIYSLLEKVRDPEEV